MTKNGKQQNEIERKDESMLNDEARQRISDIDEQIRLLMEEKENLNPFSKLNMMSWKEFGEEFSEQYVLDRVPNLKPCRGAGHDMFSKRLGYIEVKSGRLPYKRGWTFNQLHPSECDWYLFVFYDTENYDVTIYLVSSTDITDADQFSISKQHGDGCFSMYCSLKNEVSLQQYRVKDWDTLNDLV